ncbi:transposase [Salicibibacter cibarius]|uniref:Transposase n=1 Tax=Salicibibacter cibarius TaxID=2743000 RepID=A0A7T7CDS5_9BACI|nr:transposase [Salicibibacter cibarius]
MKITTTLCANGRFRCLWDCSYPIILIPKYRRKIFLKKMRKDVREVLISLCEDKNVELVQGSISADHVRVRVL